MSAPTPVPLPYADLLARWGIAVEKGPGLVRISIPPVASWKHLGTGFHVSFFLVVGFYVIWTLLEGRWAWLKGGREWGAYIIWTSAYLLGLAIMIAWAWQRLRHRMVVEVDDVTVKLTWLSSHRIIRSASWARSEVGEGKYNASNGKLLLRITGRDLVEVHISPNREVTEAVAKMLNAAVQAPLVTQPATKRLHQDISPPMRRGPLRSALIASSIMIGFIGLIMFFTPLAPIALHVMMLAAIPAGIALGTRPREYYI